MIYNVSFKAAKITTPVAYGPCRLISIHGNNAQASDRYVQFHSKLDALQTGDVPDVKSLYCPASTGFQWPLNDIWLPSLSVGISSTMPDYTAAGAGTALDMTLVIDTDFFLNPDPNAATYSGMDIVGDLTSAVAGRTIWGDGTTTYKLLRVDVKNNAAGTRYARFAAAAATGDTVAPVRSIAAGTTKVFMFGPGGFRPYKKTDLNTAVTGCRIMMSTSGEPSYSVDATADYNIRAVIQTTDVR